MWAACCSTEEIFITDVEKTHEGCVRTNLDIVSRPHCPMRFKKGSRGCRDAWLCQSNFTEEIVGIWSPTVTWLFVLLQLFVFGELFIIVVCSPYNCIGYWLIVIPCLSVDLATVVVNHDNPVYLYFVFFVHCLFHFSAHLITSKQSIQPSVKVLVWILYWLFKEFI